MYNFHFQIKNRVKNDKSILKVADDNRLLWYFPHVVLRIRVEIHFWWLAINF